MDSTEFFLDFFFKIFSSIFFFAFLQNFQFGVSPATFGGSVAPWLPNSCRYGFNCLLPYSTGAVLQTTAFSDTVSDIASSLMDLIVINL